jgi:hypothetical protein
VEPGEPRLPQLQQMQQQEHALLHPLQHMEMVLLPQESLLQQKCR